MIDEKIRVETKLYPKNGRAKVKHKRNPFSVYPYDPRDQIPKLVIKKKIQAPINAPDILDKIFEIKYFANKPIKITLPHVKNVTECKPITKSVKIKANIRAGRYLIPNNAGI
jgi:hypothetical protein